MGRRYTFFFSFGTIVERRSLIIGTVLREQRQYRMWSAMLIRGAQILCLSAFFLATFNGDLRLEDLGNQRDSGGL